MSNKIFMRIILSIKQSCRHKHLGTKEINLKDPAAEKKLPVFQYPVSQENDRRIYVWGLADTGALGIAKKQTKLKGCMIKNPSRLSFGETHHVTAVACGFGFTVFSVKSEDYKVYGTGINTDSQIGYQESRIDSPLELLQSPSPINLPFHSTEKAKVLQMSAGRAHLLILTSEGLFTLGNNSYGQCGRKIVEDESYVGSSYINHISKINEQKISSVECGQDHSLLLTEKGEVYSCGWGADGQTGLGHYNTRSQFSRVLGDIQGEVITKLACSADCVLALNDKNEVFGWGNSEYGQLLANSDVQQINTSVYLKICKDIGKIVDIASGGSFCMALNDRGEVYVWGYGILGNGPEVQCSTKPSLIPSVLFGQNDFQPDNRVVSISCGIAHLGAVTNNGDLYMWGKNRSGCLGLGHNNDQYFPLKVAIGASVIKLSCGLDHSVAFCKPFM